MQQQDINVSDILKQELARRCQKNARYSLRAFASSLGLSSSFVSKLLNGQRPLTAKVLDQIADKLLLQPDQLLALRFKMSGQSSTLSEQQNIQFYQIKQDQFSFISDWHHFAILELMTVPKVQFNIESISKELQISEHEAKSAIDRLIRLNLIEKNKKGKWVAKKENGSAVSSSISSAAAQKLQKQILEKANQVIGEVPLDLRSQSAMTMAIPSSRLNEAKELITRFRREFTQIMQSKGERDSVYQLSISFFPLTQYQNLKNK